MKAEYKNATERSLKRKSRPAWPELPYNVWCEQSQKMCVKILPGGTDLILHNPFFFTYKWITSRSGKVEHTEPYDFTAIHIFNAAFSPFFPPTNTHVVTLSMAIPGIFKTCFLTAWRGSWGLAEKGREFLWPMWNSTACISLYTPARTHTDRPTPHFYCGLHMHNHKTLLENCLYLV